MKRLANPTQNQLIALGILVFSAGAIFSPPLQVSAQPSDNLPALNADTEGTPQPLATPKQGTTSNSISSPTSTRAIGTITGQGTTGNIAKFTGANAIGNSVFFENGGKVGLGTTAPSASLSVVSSGVAVLGASTNDTGVNGTSTGGNAMLGDSVNGTGVRGRHIASTGTFPGVFGATNSTDANSFGVQGVINPTSGGAGSAGMRGINNTTSGNGYGVYGSQAGNGVGVYGTTPNGNGVIGRSTTSTGVSGVSTGGFGAAGQSTNNDGVYGESYQSDGVYGTSSKAAGVHGYSSGYSGVRGDSDGGEGITGVSSTGRGVAGTGIVGVVGNANSSSNPTNGVLGIAYSSNASSAGVLGNDGNNGKGPAYAGYFLGNVYVNGNLGKASGSFKIDHPLHPATEYLSHSFVESPDMMNIYNGNTTTDGKGNAWVQLPSYFSALNRDFRYQLTPIGQFAQAIIGQEIHGTRFQIKTDKPHIKVSWMVTGIRNDVYARQHRIRVEETKAAFDRGKYLYPAGFGAGQDKQIGPGAPRLAAR